MMYVDDDMLLDEFGRRCEHEQDESDERKEWYCSVGTMGAKRWLEDVSSSLESIISDEIRLFSSNNDARTAAETVCDDVGDVDDEVDECTAVVSSSDDVEP